MIKFFRSIRQQFLSENKFSKYLLYAVGEILLVVIGILLAIRIDDWNRASVLKQEEKEAYQIIITDLKRDSVLFVAYETNYRRYMDAYFQLNKVRKGEEHFSNTDPDPIVMNVEFNPVVQNNNLPLIEKLRDNNIRNRMNSYFRRLNQVRQAAEEFNQLVINKSRTYFLEERNIFDNDLVFDYEDRTFPPFKRISVLDTVSLGQALKSEYAISIISEMRMSLGFYLSVLDMGKEENHKLIQELQREISE